MNIVLFLYDFVWHVHIIVYILINCIVTGRAAPKLSHATTFIYTSIQTDIILFTTIAFNYHQKPGVPVVKPLIRLCTNLCGIYIYI